MNGKLAHKIRQAAKRAWKEDLDEMRDLPLGHRIALCWWLMFGRKHKL